MTKPKPPASPPTSRTPTSVGRLKIKVPMLFEAEGEGMTSILAVVLLAFAVMGFAWLMAQAV